MKVALLTEGQSEFGSLPFLYAQFKERTGHQFLAPLKIHVSPDAAPRMIAKTCIPALKMMLARGAKLIVILLDRETQEDCPGAIARELESCIANKYAAAKVCVALKDRAYENWLIADLRALELQPARFKVTRAIKRKVEPNKADACEGKRILDSARIGGRYEKVVDSGYIMKKFDVGRGSAHSRSLRHFLHLIGDSEYSAQCQRPHHSDSDSA